MSFSAEYTCCEPPPPPTKIARYSLAIRHHHHHLDLSAYVNNVAHHIPSYLFSATTVGGGGGEFHAPAAFNCFEFGSVGVNVAAAAAGALSSSGYHRHINHDIQAPYGNLNSSSSSSTDNNDNLPQIRLAAAAAAAAAAANRNGGNSGASGNMTTITISPAAYYNSCVWSGKEKDFNNVNGSRAPYNTSNSNVVNNLCMYNNFKITSSRNGVENVVSAAAMGCSASSRERIFQAAGQPVAAAAAAALINVNTSLSLTTTGLMGGGTPVAAAAATLSMHPQLWSKLPEELVELILALLPIRSVFRMRQVCKAWKDVVLSREFGSLRAQQRRRRWQQQQQEQQKQKEKQQQQQWQLPWPATPAPIHGIRILAWKGDGGGEEEERVRRHGAYFLALNRSRYQQLAAYEVVSRKWCSFALDFLPTTVAYPIAAAGGLICFLGGSLDTLIVCNPLTRKWKELPTMPNNNGNGGGGNGGRRVPYSISMAVDEEGGGGYKIVVAEAMGTEMYDSEKGEWERCGGLPKEEDMGGGGTAAAAAACGSRGGMVEVGGGYMLCLSRGGGPGSGSGLLAFNLKTREWSKLMTGRIPGYSKFRHLVECGGSILVIGKALRRYVLGLYIWRLDRSTLRWREVGKMPRSICDQFFTSPSECFYCTAHSHYIFISRYFHNQAFVYDTLHGSWHQVGGCPLLTHPLLLPFSPGLDPLL